MTAADGQVLGVEKIVDNGPDSLRWNLVVLGDGYREPERQKYEADVADFVGELRATAPYDELWSAINIHRVDVISTDSGADDPGECAGGTGQTVRTYFDATFCSEWNGRRLDRLLTVDDTRAKQTARQLVPATHQVLVIVNSPKYGGAGGPVAVCSTDPMAAEIAIHEIGHSAFHLADEYESAGTAPAGPEPPQPNITRNPDRATIKWGPLVAPSTPMPSYQYGDCTPAPANAPATGVGAYEGAGNYHCGMYRPLQACYMRDYSPFCPVCAGVIRATLQPFVTNGGPTGGGHMPDLTPDEIAEKVRRAGAVTFRGWLGTEDGDTYYLLMGPWGNLELQIKGEDILHQLEGSTQADGWSIVWVRGDADIAKCEFGKAHKFAEAPPERFTTTPEGSSGPEYEPPPRYPRY